MELEQIKPGDKVRINEGILEGQVGHVTGVDREDYVVYVSLDRETFIAKDVALYPAVLVDEKREVMIRLAETLDSARKQAKAIEDTDDMDGTPRLIQTAMENALMDLTAFNQTGQVLDFIVEEGLSVREALKKVGK